MNELLVAVSLIAGVVAAHEIGFWLGPLTRSARPLIDKSRWFGHPRRLWLRSWSALHFRGQHRASPIGRISL
jgi:hypothetical protein